ncbi:hypothetical protein AOLI_G00326000 [Acnodon oligacanthus]
MVQVDKGLDGLLFWCADSLDVSVSSSRVSAAMSCSLCCSGLREDAGGRRQENPWSSKFATIPGGSRKFWTERNLRGRET